MGTSPTQLITTPTLPDAVVTAAQLQACKDEYYRRYYTKREDIHLPIGASISVGPITNKKRIRP